MVSGNLEKFVSNAIARGQISFGDVRRLQRGYLANGITNREEAEMLIALNSKLVRADKAWAEWLIAAVREFVVTREECAHPAEKPAGSLEHLVAATASGTKLGRKIARQIRRELAQLRSTDPESSHQSGSVIDLTSGEWRGPTHHTAGQCHTSTLAA